LSQFVYAKRNVIYANAHDLNMLVYDDVASIVQHMIMILFVVVADYQLVEPRCNTHRGRNVFLRCTVKEWCTFVYGTTYVWRTQSSFAM
jgi:hypothetical protein